jgi:hypothetical protein
MTGQSTSRPRPLPADAHTDRPWRVHALAPDFRLEDVWALATPGGPDDLERLVSLMTSSDNAEEFPASYRLLFALRWRLGALLGLDRPDASVGRRVASVRERLPADLAGSVGPPFAGAPFQPVYLTHDEFVAEIANRTVHGLLHLGWVEDADAPGTHRAQMAVLVKPNGLLGEAYLALIKPFRHLVVYPALVRTVARVWAKQAEVAA